jgi:uncharacterized protein YbjT (DUF2867 family)
MARNVLILGGTGFVGSALAEKLVRRNGGGSAQVIVTTRRLRHGAHLQSLPTVEVRQVDVHDDAQLLRAVSQVDAVVNLIAQLHGSEAAFERVHAVLPARIAQACTRAGVTRLVHVSALGVDEGAPSRYLRSKARGERALLRARTEHPALQLDILRPSVMFGARDRLTNLFADLQAFAPLIPLAAANALMQPVWVDDVAQAIVCCLDGRAAGAPIVECAGPDVMTLRDIVRASGRFAGHARPVLALPDALGRLQALCMELLPGEPLMSRDNLDSASVPNVASGTLPGLASLGIHAASFEQVVPTYLGADAGARRLDPWRRFARRDR